MIQAVSEVPTATMLFSLTRVGFLFTFAVQVNTETSTVTIQLCKPADDDLCEAILDQMSTNFSRLNIGSSVISLAMLYAEGDNVFMRSIRFHCKLKHNGKRMCWNPQSFSAEFCD